MKPGDLATVQRIFAAVAPTAAAEMKGRVLSCLRELHQDWNLHEPGGPQARVLDAAISRVELLPISKED
jgi:hypothetical protein